MKIYNCTEANEKLPHQVDVWHIPYDVGLINLHNLSDDEIRRSESLKFDIHKYRYLAYRSALRDILANYINITPKDVLLEYTTYGKPYQTNSTLQIEFNMSHSYDLATLAITQQYLVGIDVEQVLTISNIEDFVRKFFSGSEQEKFNLLSEDKKLFAFYQAWTGKEAYGKAIGAGLSFPLQEFSVSFNESCAKNDICISTSTNVGFDWSLFCYSYDINNSSYVISCVVLNRDLKICRNEYRP